MSRKKKPRTAPRPIVVERYAVNPKKFPWTPELIELLGTMTDEALARQLGVNTLTVGHERRRRGIPSFRTKRPDVVWTEEMISLLGTESDYQIADILHLHHHSVARKRRILGIPPYCGRSPKPWFAYEWTSERDALLGTMTDSDLALKLRISKNVIAYRRNMLAIPAFAPKAPLIRWTPEMIEAFGKVTDREIAERHGISRLSVQNKRPAPSSSPRSSSSCCTDAPRAWCNG